MIFFLRFSMVMPKSLNVCREHCYVHTVILSGRAGPGVPSPSLWHGGLRLTPCMGIAESFLVSMLVAILQLTLAFSPQACLALWDTAHRLREGTTKLSLGTDRLEDAH